MNFIKWIQKGETGDSAIREPSVDFTPFVTKKWSILLLQTADILNDLRNVYLAALWIIYLSLWKLRRVKIA